MDITVYLPDELGQRAKLAELPLSRLLRAAVTIELARKEAIDRAAGRASEQRLDLEDDAGRAYVGRFNGTRIASRRDGLVDAYLAADGRVLLHQVDNQRVWVFAGERTVELGDWLVQWLGSDRDALLDAAEALGVTVEVEI